MSEKCVLFFEKSEVIFTKWCFIFVLFFDKSDYDHWTCEQGDKLTVRIYCTFTHEFQIIHCNLELDVNIYSSFPVIHKVDNVGIFVQLLMGIDWNCLPVQI